MRTALSFALFFFLKYNHFPVIAVYKYLTDLPEHTKNFAVIQNSRDH